MTLPPRPAAGRAGASRHRRGFTLVESIAAITILAAVASVASGILWAAVDAYSKGATAAVLHNEGSLAMERIIREFHNIPKKTGGATVAPEISSVTATSITWNTNYSLSLSGSQLTLTVGGGTARVLLNDVSSVTIQTYNESNAALAASLSGAACDPIRRISVQFTHARTGVSETLRTRLFLRCTMAGAVP
jgi:prepilin-type N-terminal cleavage/methylation domain-containing protein